MHFVTKVMHIIIINSVLLPVHKPTEMIKTCSIGHTVFINVNILRGGHTHTHMPWTKAISRNQLHTGTLLV